MRSLRSLQGMSFVEVLVVLVLMGLLMALLMPAIMQSRESARRLQCQTNLRQVGHAAIAHESSRGRYPPGNSTLEDETGDYIWERGKASVLFHLLPFIEQAELHDGLLRIVDEKVLDAPRLQQAVATYICPSAPYFRDEFGLAPTCYIACNGARDWLHDDGPSGKRGRGMFGINSTIRIQDVRDGLSQTLLFAETVPGGASVRYYQQEEKYQACLEGDPGEGRIEQMTGRSFALFTVPPVGFFTTEYTPNSQLLAVACEASSQRGAAAARSDHPLVVHGVMADGSVHGVVDDIDADVWRALGPISDAR